MIFGPGKYRVGAASAADGGTVRATVAEVAPTSFAATLFALLILVGAAADVAQAAPATQPANVNAIESTPLRHGTSASGSAKTTGLSSGEGFGVFRVFGALAIVVGAILVLRWGSKRFLGLQVPGAGSSGIRVLSRQVIAPRQQLMLIQVGRRILLVANSGAQMNSLCEVTDAEESAAILAQVNERKLAAAGKPFWSFFRREQTSFNETEPPASTARTEQIQPELASTREEIHGLLSKVQAISRGFKKA